MPLTAPRPAWLQGGRNSKDPILREDVFLLKTRALGKQVGRHTFWLRLCGVAAAGVLEDYNLGGVDSCLQVV
jgi:hypothetical protein